MKDISPSVWQQNNNGNWVMYFNIDSESEISSSKNTEKSKQIKALSNDKNLILGTLVMTPKGIGRLIKLNEDESLIRFKDNEEKIPKNKISNYFSVLISDHSMGNINIIRLKLKSTGKVGDIFEQLEKMKKIYNKNNNILIMNGMDLKKDYTFEQLNILNNSKILLLTINSTIYTLSRFLNITKNWYSYAIDGICFSSSKKILLNGVGIFCPMDNNTIVGTLRILNGTNNNCPVLVEKIVEIKPCSNELDSVYQCYFNKPIPCNQNQDYSIVLTSTKLANCYFGQRGRKVVEGENGVTFLFKKYERSATTPEQGNFPELYYSSIN